MDVGLHLHMAEHASLLLWLRINVASAYYIHTDSETIINIVALTAATGKYPGV